jgi:hypothetical protein
MQKYPYNCEYKVKSYGINPTFTPTRIDYENQMVWHQKGQSSGNGEWIDFEDIIFTRNLQFKNLVPNKLITIGFTGIKRSYLNISQEEVIRRYCEEDNISELDGQTIDDFEFDDEFDCYKLPNLR